MSDTPATECDPPSYLSSDHVTVNEDEEVKGTALHCSDASQDKDSPKDSSVLSPASTPKTPSTKSTTVKLTTGIIVVWNDQLEVQTLWGRVDVAMLSYKTFVKKAFDTLILHPSEAPPRNWSLFKRSDRAIWRKAYKYLRADFLCRAKLRPRFAIPANGLGGRGEDAFILQSVGWRAMALQLSSIRVEYNLPDEFPGKADFLRMHGPFPKQ
ncbi:hypothetical protein VTO73DRAFT_6530 [Trametes versicolor]